MKKTNENGRGAMKTSWKVIYSNHPKEKIFSDGIKKKKKKSICIQVLHRPPVMSTLRPL